MKKRLFYLPLIYIISSKHTDASEVQMKSREIILADLNKVTINLKTHIRTIFDENIDAYVYR